MEDSMQLFLNPLLAAVIVMSFGEQAKEADDGGVQSILDKATDALGGQDKLSRIKAVTWKTKGRITTKGIDYECASTLTVQGLDRFRVTFESDFMGTKLKVVTVLAGAKAWRRVGNRKTELDENALAVLKRAVYLEVVPIKLVSLRDKSFKVSVADEKKVGGKPAVGLKVTPPDGKSFILYFDKESGLPVMLTDQGGLGGNQFTEETTFADYKDFGGIKKATKIVARRDGEKYLQSEITEFKVLDGVDAATFDEPK